MKNRSIPGITPLTRKKTGTKVDILIKHFYDDFSVGEAGLSGGAVSTKYITESSLKLSKPLKDIVWNLSKMSTKDTEHLRTELTVKLMAVPVWQYFVVYIP
ncbi:hypothetical protein INT45_008398 [Circinella minor]|uniref:Uncharacterized protein n=1 Tax=Circinella minor TaxID=1195481 RepID=A0A8H7RXR0_9FUNG|nr:hypothetical protein INT45_008398 [Circinella minor]